MVGQYRNPWGTPYGGHSLWIGRMGNSIAHAEKEEIVMRE